MSLRGCLAGIWECTCGLQEAQTALFTTGQNQNFRWNALALSIWRNNFRMLIPCLLVVVEDTSIRQTWSGPLRNPQVNRERTTQRNHHNQYGKCRTNDYIQHPLWDYCLPNMVTFQWPHLIVPNTLQSRDHDHPDEDIEMSHLLKLM